MGVVGLGVGGVAPYARARQEWDFYELDPDVARIAEEHFSYVKGCRAQTRVITGDARLELQARPSVAYDLLVLDAFHSDAMPIHLATRISSQPSGCPLLSAGLGRPAHSSPSPWALAQRRRESHSISMTRWMLAFVLVPSTFAHSESAPWVRASERIINNDGSTMVVAPSVLDLQGEWRPASMNSNPDGMCRAFELGQSRFLASDHIKQPVAAVLGAGGAIERWARASTDWNQTFAIRLFVCKASSSQSASRPKAEDRAERVLDQQDATTLIVDPYVLGPNHLKMPISGRDSDLQGVCIYLGFGEKVSVIVRGNLAGETVAIDSTGQIFGLAHYMGFYIPDYNMNSAVKSIVCKQLAVPR